MLDFEQQLIIYFHWSLADVEDASYFDLQDILNATRKKEDQTITGEDLKEQGGFSSLIN